MNLLLSHIKHLLYEILLFLVCHTHGEIDTRVVLPKVDQLTRVMPNFFGGGIYNICVKFATSCILCSQKRLRIKKMKDSDDGGAEMLTLIILTTSLCFSQILKTNHKEGQNISNKS